MAPPASPPESGARSRHWATLRVPAHDPVEVADSGTYRFYTFDRQPLVGFLATSLPGLGSGEELAVTVRVEPEADLVLTGQGPTSLLRTCSTSRYSTRLEVEPRGDLTYLPWATVPFRGSRCEIETEAVVGHDGSFIGWELLSSGRVGYGEELELELLRSSWRVRREGPLVEDRFEICRSQRGLLKTALAGHTHIGTMYLCASAERLPSARALRRATDAPTLAVSRVSNDLIIVKALGHSAEGIETSFWPILRLARAALGLRELPPPAVGRRWLRSGLLSIGSP